MRLLLDSHALLWWSLGDDRLPDTARRAIGDDAVEVFVSAASVWELSIKFGLGKLPKAERFVADLRTGEAITGFRELAVTRQHAVHAGILDVDHRDPFDRMLIAQAQDEDLALVSNERVFDAYGVRRVW